MIPGPASQQHSCWLQPHRWCTAKCLTSNYSEKYEKTIKNMYVSFYMFLSFHRVVQTMLLNAFKFQELVGRFLPCSRPSCCFWPGTRADGLEMSRGLDRPGIFFWCVLCFVFFWGDDEHDMTNKHDKITTNMFVSHLFPNQTDSKIVFCENALRFCTLWNVRQFAVYLSLKNLVVCFLLEQASGFGTDFYIFTSTYHRPATQL